MAKYFNYFPKTPYYKGKNSTSLDVVTNITTRFNFDNRFRQNAATYYKYKIKDGELLWKLDPFSEPTWEWLHHQFIFIRYLCAAYENTNDPVFLDKINDHLVNNNAHLVNIILFQHILCL